MKQHSLCLRAISVLMTGIMFIPAAELSTFADELEAPLTADIKNLAYDAETHLLSADVTYQNLPENSTAWIGVVPTDTAHDEDASDSAALEHQYLSSFASGEYPGAVLEHRVGSFDLRIFDDTYGGSEIACETFEIASPGPLSAALEGVTFDEEHRILSFSVSYENLDSAYYDSWVAVVPSDTAHTPDETYGQRIWAANLRDFESGAAQEIYIYTQYIGNYDIRVFDTAKGEELACETVEIGEPVALAASIDRCDWLEDHRILDADLTLYGVTQQTNAWVGWMPSDTPDTEAKIGWDNAKYLKDITEPNVSFRLIEQDGAVISGSYDLRIYDGTGEDKVLLAKKTVEIPEFVLSIENLAWDPVRRLLDADVVGEHLPDTPFSLCAEVTPEGSEYAENFIWREFTMNSPRTHIRMLIPEQIAGNVTLKVRNYAAHGGFDVYDSAVQMFPGVKLESPVEAWGEKTWQGDGYTLSYQFAESFADYEDHWDFQDSYDFCNVGDLSAYDDSLIITGCTAEDESEPIDCVIPAEIGGRPVTRIDSRSLQYHVTLRSLTIPASVTHIGYAACTYQEQLETVTFEEGSAPIFEDYEPDEADIQAGYVYEPSQNSDGTFSNCISLREITLPKDTVQLAASMFNGCSSLTRINLEDLTAITEIPAYAFYDASALTEITLPDNITKIGKGAFEDISLKQIALPDKITKIDDYAFANCALAQIVIPDSVRTIGRYAFSKQEADGTPTLERLQLGNSLAEICDGAFEQNSLLTEIVLPDSLTVLGEYAFGRCSSIHQIMLPDSLTELGKGSFDRCSSLSEVTFPNNPDFTVVRGFNGCFRLPEDFLDTLPESVTEIGEEAFNNCSFLEELTIPSRITTIGRAAFAHCFKLTSVTLPDNLSVLGEEAFSDCDALTAVSLPDSLKEIGDNAFQNCKNLANITLPDTLKVLGMGMFDGCAALETVTIPKAVSEIPADAFRESGITEINIPANVKQIGDFAFYQCNSLQSVTIADGVQTIGEGAFERYKTFYDTEIILPESVERIGAGAFAVNVRSDASVPNNLILRVLNPELKLRKEADDDDSLDTDTRLRKYEDIFDGRGRTNYQNVTVYGCPENLAGEESELAAYMALLQAYDAENGTECYKFIPSGEIKRVYVTGKVTPADAEILVTEQNRTRTVTPEADGSFAFNAHADRELQLRFVRNGYYDEIRARGAKSGSTWKIGSVTLEEMPVSNVLTLTVADSEGNLLTDASGLAFTVKADGETLRPGTDYTLDFPYLTMSSARRIGRETEITVQADVTDPALKRSGGAVTGTAEYPHLQLVLPVWGRVKISTTSAYTGGQLIMIFDENGCLAEAGEIDSSSANAVYTYVSGRLPAGDYTAVAMNRSDCSAVPDTLGQLGEMGFTNQDYLKNEFRAEDDRVTALEMHGIPVMQTSRFTRIADTERCSVRTDAVQPIAGVRFRAAIGYAFTDFCTGDKAVRITLPKDAALTAVSDSRGMLHKGTDYTVSGSTVTVLHAALSGCIYVDLTLGTAGLHMIAAALKYGSIVSPAGSCTCYAKACRLTAASEQITTNKQPFTVTVTAAPQTAVAVSVNGELRDTVTTDKSGIGTASVALPANLSLGDDIIVTAQTAAGGSESLALRYFPTGTGVQEMYFVQSGNRWYVCRNGKFEGAINYTYVYNGNQDNMWSFCATINSGLEIDSNSVRTTVTMKNGSTQTVQMYLKETAAQDDGTTDYIYTGSLSLSHPNSHSFRADRIPCAVSLEYDTKNPEALAEYWNTEEHHSTEIAELSAAMKEAVKEAKAEPNDYNDPFTPEFLEEYREEVHLTFTEIYYYPILDEIAEDPENPTAEEQEEARRKAEEKGKEAEVDILAPFDEEWYRDIDFENVFLFHDAWDDEETLYAFTDCLFEMTDTGSSDDDEALRRQLEESVNQERDMIAALKAAIHAVCEQLTIPGLLTKPIHEYQDNLELAEDLGIDFSGEFKKKFRDAAPRSVKEESEFRSECKEKGVSPEDERKLTAESLGMTDLNVSFDPKDLTKAVITGWNNLKIADIDYAKAFDRVLGLVKPINKHDTQALLPQNRKYEPRSLLEITGTELDKLILTNEETTSLEEVLKGLGISSATDAIGSESFVGIAEGLGSVIAEQMNNALRYARNIRAQDMERALKIERLCQYMGAAQTLVVGAGRFLHNVAKYGGKILKALDFAGFAKTIALYYAIQARMILLAGDYVRLAALKVYWNQYQLKTCDPVQENFIRTRADCLNAIDGKMEMIWECMVYYYALCCINCGHNMTKIVTYILEYYNATAGAPAAAGTGGATAPISGQLAFLISLFPDVYDLATSTTIDECKRQLTSHLKQMDQFQRDINMYCDTYEIPCDPIITPDPPESILSGGEGDNTDPPGTQLIPFLDPSGTVYEAVESNPLAGVTAEVWFSEHSDGSDAVLWDAENYIGQVNPQITGSDGTYAWYVPDGWWQVRFTKKGYADAQTDWMEVPPPRTLLTTGMVSEAAPEIADIAAYPDYIEVIFSQYMDTVSALTVPDGYQYEWIDKTPVSAGSKTEYAKILHMIPAENAVVGDKVSAALSGAKNYAGTALEKYKNTLTVQARPAELVLNYTGQISVQINESPSPRAAVRVLDSEGNPMPGLTVTAQADSDFFAVIDRSAETDADGIAHFSIAGELPGKTALTFAVGGTALQKTLPLLVTNEENRPARPTAVIGDTVFNADSPKENYIRVQPGEKLVLACDTKDAVIYYTTDGSCPCQNTASRKEYTEPITLEANTYYRIAAYVEGQDYSERLNINVTTSQLAGDVNSDGVLSVADAVILARFVAEDEKLTAKQIAAISGSDSADLDSDGIVTMLDVNALLRKLATASAD